MERQTVAKVQKNTTQNHSVRRQSAAPSSPAHRFTALQRSIGNQAVRRLINSRYIQAKLQVSTPGDQYEQEADRVAEKVMRMTGSSTPSEKTGPAVQRKCACEGGGADCPKCAGGQEKVQKKPLSFGITSFVQRVLQREPKRDDEDEISKNKSGPLGTDEEVVHLKPLKSNKDGPLEKDEDSIDREMADSVERGLGSSGNGESLPEGVRTHMESAIGADFSDVRVHTDQSAVQMNQDLGARAFTHGKNIYFNRNSYNPATSSGKKLLAHELTHVVQQTGGGLKRAVRPTDESEEVKQISKKDIVHRAPKVTAVTGPSELPANLGRRATFTATATRGTALNWTFGNAAALGAVPGTSTGRTNTLTAPVGSTGGVVTVTVADAANPADIAPVPPAPPLNLTLVEIQQPTFAFAPGMPAFAPANTMDASVCDNTATATAVTVPAGRPVTWSIVGNRRGATIDPVTGVIRPSATQTGDIVVRAADNALPAARNEQTLTIQGHPTGITRTELLSSLPIAGVFYGGVYKHHFTSSGGAITSIVITERVFCGSSQFAGCAGLPVVPGTLNARSAFFSDRIGTPVADINVNNFLPSPPNPGLPQVFDTPQILYWRSDQCSAAPGVPPAAVAGDHWVPFVNVPIKVTLSGTAPNFFVDTSDNGLVVTPRQRYRGTALAAPGAPPVASVCGAGESLSKMTFSPPSIAADNSALTTTAGTVLVTPGGNQITWSFPGPNFGAALVAPGNPALFRAGNNPGRVRVRAEMTATPGCFTEGWLRMQEVEIGPAITFAPASVRAGGTTRATVATSPGSRVVLWTIEGPNLGAAIARNPDNSATITAGPRVGRIIIRATDERDATKFAEASLIIS